MKIHLSSDEDVAAKVSKLAHLNEDDDDVNIEDI